MFQFTYLNLKMTPSRAESETFITLTGNNKVFAKTRMHPIVSACTTKKVFE